MSDIIGEITFKEKPDIAQVFIRQLDRTNQAAMISPDIHQASTYQILANLPTKWRAWVYDQEDRYTNYDPRWIFKTSQGYDIGTKENPHLIDDTKPVRRLYGVIDWLDPNIYSPKIDTTPPPIDYRAFNELVMEAAEQAKLTWREDPLEQDAGDTEEYIIERKNTPFRKPRVPDTEG